MKKIFYKKVNKRNNKKMFEFLKGHETYYTMNSWNRTKSIANNVKVYTIGLDYDILNILEADNYFEVNQMIEMWEEENKGYRVGFNGRSGGYLVLYNEKGNDTILDYVVAWADNYEEFKSTLKDDGMTLQDYRDKLIEQVEIVQSFDLLCDNIRELCLHMKEHCKIVEEEIATTQTMKCLKWQ